MLQIEILAGLTLEKDVEQVFNEIIVDITNSASSAEL
jgi:hypothetical protein